MLNEFDTWNEKRKAKVRMVPFFIKSSLEKRIENSMGSNDVLHISKRKIIYILFLWPSQYKKKE